jgi:hypothetical protein
VGAGFCNLSAARTGINGRFLCFFGFASFFRGLGHKISPYQLRNNPVRCHCPEIITVRDFSKPLSEADLVFAVKFAAKAAIPHFLGI